MALLPERLISNKNVVISSTTITVAIVVWLAIQIKVRDSKNPSEDQLCERFDQELNIHTLSNVYKRTQ
jgi:hypothetical protein